MQKISDFINHALFNPTNGYYRTKNPIGKNSDFITAPEISQVFGELLAVYFLQIASAKKTPISFVEMGAGKGTLYFDILSAIKKLAQKNITPAVDFIDLTTFHIIEINPVLQKIQQQILHEVNVTWHENFADFLSHNSSREIFFLSNELFDCFPIDQFVFTELGWRERMIEGKKFVLGDFDKKTHNFIEKEVNAFVPIGAVFEYNLAAREFMKQLCEALKNQGGIAINIDYGYIKNEFANTLQALKNHQKVDILENPGEADITSLVDFASLQKIAQNYHLNLSLISQKDLLLSLGIEERRKILIARNPAQESSINSAIDRLIDSSQMGELFKCIIVWNQ